MKKSLFVFLAILLLLLPACNIPVVIQTVPNTQNPALAYTAAAQTIEAELTKLAPTPLPTATATPIIPPTLIPIPTSTTVPSATAVPIPCNRATFNPATIDVTVPDGTIMLPGQGFTKTWRLTNNGTCTWTSAYQLAFHQGDGMGVPAGYAQSLTSGTVPPGGTVDISVTLTAPVAVGNYKGYWRLREPGGTYFGLGNANGDFTVVIAVGGDTIVNLNPVVAESGSVSASGSVSPNVYNVGDTITNDGTQIFLSFDISSIPTGSTIKNVKFDITQGYTVPGAPFTTLGCLYYYAHNYGTLDAGDFTLIPPIGGLIKLCNLSNLDQVISGDSDWKDAVQARVGTTRFQIRMQFADHVTDMNATADLVKPGTIKITITYQKPGAD